MHLPSTAPPLLLSLLLPLCLMAPLAGVAAVVAPAATVDKLVDKVVHKPVNKGVDKGVENQVDKPVDKSAVPDSPAVQAAALFERDWNWQLRRHPERATSLGIHRYNAWLTDTSLAARSAAVEHERQMLAAAQNIDRAALEDQDLVSYDLFVRSKQVALAAASLTAFDPQPLSAFDGPHVQLPRLVAQMPFANAANYLTYIARLQALPAHIDGIIEQLRAGERAGWTTPKAVLAPLPDALRAMRAQLGEGPLGAPFTRIPASIAPDVREQLRTLGGAALNKQVAPALARLEDYLRQAYLPTARESIGASALPGGAEWYGFLVRSNTTTEMTPQQVHALGLQEVARLRAAIGALIPRTGFRGDFREFIVFARNDRRLFFASPAALLDRYRRTLALAQARLGRVVATLPAATPESSIVVKPMGAAGIGQPAAYYEAGFAGRSAALVVDTSALGARPIWQVDSVVLHESVPGHHLQVTRAQELAALPAFRRHGFYNAFVEGWATYAESLGPELGLFQDPFSLFGHLNEEMFRAARLVVDTGIHAQGWTRRQAIDYLDAHTANPPADNEAEVDRYIAQPGQALGYKIGQLRILALRTQARAALGERFELGRFHDAVLAGGALPLPDLERQLGRWIARERDPATPRERAPEASFNAPVEEETAPFEPRFEFEFEPDSGIDPGIDPGPAPDFVPPPPNAPAPAASSWRAPPWQE